MIPKRTSGWFVYALGCGLMACSNEDSGDEADFKTHATLDVKDYVNGELVKLTAAAEAIQKAAPAPDDDGWNAKDDKAAVDKMRSAWGDARDAYERIEGSIAVLFGDLDVATDERYDGFIEEEADDDLFDDEGVIGVHGIERILWADSIPARVVKFESALEGYKEAAFPSNREEAEAFKNKLCARLVEDTKTMRDEFKAQALDHSTAFWGMIGSMEEQSEKTSKAATGEDESRYSQRTLADMRANLDGAKAVFKAFKPWIESSSDKDADIEAGFEDIAKAYAAVSGPALPEVPASFKPSEPSEADLNTPYGKLWKLLNEQTDIENPDSLISIMAEAANEMKIPLLPDE